MNFRRHLNRLFGLLRICYFTSKDSIEFSDKLEIDIVDLAKMTKLMIELSSTTANKQRFESKIKDELKIKRLINTSDVNIEHAVVPSKYSIRKRAF